MGNAHSPSSPRPPHEVLADPLLLAELRDATTKAPPLRVRVLTWADSAEGHTWKVSYFIVQIILCVLLLVWGWNGADGFRQVDGFALITTLEGFVDFSLLVEVLLHLWLFGCRAPWRDPWHVVDCAVAALCVATFVAMVLPRDEAFLSPLWANAIFAARNVVRMLRVFVYSRWWLTEHLLASADDPTSSSPFSRRRRRGRRSRSRGGGGIRQQQQQRRHRHNEEKRQSAGSSTGETRGAAAGAEVEMAAAATATTVGDVNTGCCGPCCTDDASCLSRLRRFEVTPLGFTLKITYVTVQLTLSVLLVFWACFSSAATTKSHHHDNQQPIIQSLTAIIVEGVVDGSLVVEVVLRLILLGKAFWWQWWNVADTVIAAACVASFALYIASIDARSGYSAITQVIFGVRNCVRVARVLVFLRWWSARYGVNRQQQQQQQQQEQDASAAQRPAGGGRGADARTGNNGQAAADRGATDELRLQNHVGCLLLLKRLEYSPAGLVLNVTYVTVQLTLSAALVVWALTYGGVPPHEIGVEVLEGVVDISLALEVMLRLSYLGPRIFFRSAWNGVDVLMAVLCLVSFGVYESTKTKHPGTGTGTGTGSSSGAQDIGADAVYVLRNVARVVRVLTFLRWWSNSYVIISEHEDDIRFDVDGASDDGDDDDDGSDADGMSTSPASSRTVTSLVGSGGETTTASSWADGGDMKGGAGSKTFRVSSGGGGGSGGGIGIGGTGESFGTTWESKNSGMEESPGSFDDFSYEHVMERARRQQGGEGGEDDRGREDFRPPSFDGSGGGAGDSAIV